jgi:hypothetical protein
MEENDKGFVVNDRRIFAPGNENNEQTQPPADTEDAAEPQAETRKASQSSSQTQASHDPGQHRQLPPVDFGSFVISLAHAAMMHMGRLEDPQTGKITPNLELARHTIDTLAMLQKKTEGNLSKEESSLLVGGLTELRMLYVSICKNKQN